jgi:hypothetical protein
LIRAGKCLPVTTTEVLVKLRKPPLDNLAGESSNHFRFRLGPGEISLSLSARVKRPGEELVSMPAQLSAVGEPTADEVDAYERLLGDAMHGDAMLFVREDAVEALEDAAVFLSRDADPLVDDGDLDMLAVARTLAEVDYQYMLMPDHMPSHPDDPDGSQAFAFGYGYIKGLLQAIGGPA